MDAANGIVSTGASSRRSAHLDFLHDASRYRLRMREGLRDVVDRAEGDTQPLELGKPILPPVLPHLILDDGDENTAIGYAGLIRGEALVLRETGVLKNLVCEGRKLQRQE